MNFAFVSNYLTHHQIPFCEEMYNLLNGNFIFISTMPIEEERLSMGWMNSSKVYELRSYMNEETRRQANHILQCADVVIVGGAQGIEDFIKCRMKEDKLTFRYSERLYKKGIWRALNPKNWIRNWEENLKYRNNRLYMLCASAYTASDYAILGAYKGKTFKWGYFPEFKKYKIDELLNNKSGSTMKGWKYPHASILWAGRLIGWKHPEYAILLAEKLKNAGFSFKLRIIGNGQMEDSLLDMIKRKGLNNYVEMLGAMSPEMVRHYMEKADIFLFTSDYNEGWGAVLNEAMNSGCAVLASHAIGSVPFLIRDGYNGLIYRSGDVNSLFLKTRKLLNDIRFCHDLGRNAYTTIAQFWNAREAASRIIKLSHALMRGNKVLYMDGPCSKAEILCNNWYKG